jgi:hypothetical protein
VHQLRTKTAFSVSCNTIISAMQLLAVLWHYFHKGKRQNMTHFHTYHTRCVEYHTGVLMAQEADVEMDMSARLAKKNHIFYQGLLLPLDNLLMD